MPKKATRERIYWDACVFLDYINENPEHIDVLDGLVDDAEKGEIEILTSQISVTEVAYGKLEQDGTLSQATIKKIDGLWEPESFVYGLSEISFFVARDAREIIRAVKVARGKKKGKGIRANDALHLACAQRLKVKEFHTTDGPLLAAQAELGDKLTKILGFQVVAPHGRDKLPFKGKRKAGAAGEAKKPARKRASPKKAIRAKRGKGGKEA